MESALKTSLSLWTEFLKVRRREIYIKISNPATEGSNEGIINKDQIITYEIIVNVITIIIIVIIIITDIFIIIT